MCEQCDSGNLIDHGAPATKGGLTRRGYLDLMAAGGLAMLGGLKPGLSFAQPKDDVVRIGYLPITDATALLVAHGMGFFKEEGLVAEKPTLIRSWSSLVESFAAQKFNLVHFLKPIPVWMRYNNKFPVKIMGWAHTNGSAIVVGKDAGINSFADLKGKQVAVPYWYSMHNIVLQMAMRANGVKAVIKEQGQPLAADECNLQVMAPPDMPPALAAKKIDAYIVAEPFNALGELRAGAKMLRFTGDMWKNHPCCVVCMHESDTKDRSEWTQKVMNAVVKAQVYASANKKEVAKLLSRDGMEYLPVPQDVVERAMTLYDTGTYATPPAIKHPDWKNGRIDFNGFPYASATKLIVKAMNETVVSGDTTFLGGLDPDFVAKDLVDDRFIRKALAKFPDWRKDPTVPTGADPFTREEVIAL
ncbi:MAG: ABC transporter substrate-binding protein [Ferrovibrio sp.]|uniref:ABC transporter substrate-binding protein n=1 Tax=Ferrovibrio sp. TaxID=1917215 RepID=UPI00391D3226